MTVDEKRDRLVKREVLLVRALLGERDAETRRVLIRVLLRVLDKQRALRGVR